MKVASRIAVLYDIHGNYPALSAIINNLSEDLPDTIILGGDVILGPMSNECLNLLKSLTINSYYIKGNCETSVLNFLDKKPIPSIPPSVMEEIKWTAQSLSEENIEWIRSWPMEFHLNHELLGQLSFFHAAPGNENIILTEKTQPDIMEATFQEVISDIIVTGHTHMQYDIIVDNKRIINPGSVGMSFQGPGAYFVVMDHDIRFKKKIYNVDKASSQLMKTSYPDIGKFVKKYILDPPSKESMLKIFHRS